MAGKHVWAVFGDQESYTTASLRHVALELARLTDHKDFTKASVRSLAGRTRLSPTTVAKCLRALRDKKLITRVKGGYMVHVANRRSRMIPEHLLPPTDWTDPSRIDLEPGGPGNVAEMLEWLEDHPTAPFTIAQGDEFSYLARTE